MSREIHEVNQVGHVDDPVTEDAVNAAMMATDRHQEESTGKKIFLNILLVLAIVFVVIGVISGIFTAVNTVRLNKTIQTVQVTQQQLQDAQKQLQTEQACIARLDKQQQIDQAARTQIAADDRNIIDNLINDLTNKDQKIRTNAIKVYHQRRALNDKKREKYNVQVPDYASCTLIDAPKTPAGKTPGAAATKSASEGATKTGTTPAKSSRSVQPSGAARGTTKSVVGAPRPSVASATKSATKPAQPQPSRSRPVTQPKPSSSRPAPRPSSTPRPTPTKPVSSTAPPVLRLPTLAPICVLRVCIVGGP